MKWVRLNKYCEISGESRHSVHWKRKAGIYIDGVHTKLGDDNRVWVNLEAIEKWVEQGSKASLAG